MPVTERRRRYQRSRMSRRGSRHIDPWRRRSETGAASGRTGDAEGTRPWAGAARAKSLSVRCDSCGLKYSSGSGLRAMPHQLQRASQASVGDLAAEMAAFNRQARQLLGRGTAPELTLGAIRRERLNNWQINSVTFDLLL